jgi:hypothetical protein
MPTNGPPNSQTGKPEPLEKPVSPERESSSKGAQGADRDQTPPQHEKRIERFKER